MDGNKRVELIKDYSYEYKIDELQLTQLMLVVKDENQFKRCCGMLLEGFCFDDVMNMVIWNKI